MGSKVRNPQFAACRRRHIILILVVVVADAVVVVVIVTSPLDYIYSFTKTRGSQTDYGNVRFYCNWRGRIGLPGYLSFWHDLDRGYM